MCWPCILPATSTPVTIILFLLGYWALDNIERWPQFATLNKPKMCLGSALPLRLYGYELGVV
jgi:hypothetical protein